jgi:integrase
MEHAPSVADPALVARFIEYLIPYWGDKKVSSIKGATCRKFAESHTQAIARRSLETLRAAVNHFHREYGLDPVPAFTMPTKAEARDRWLTRDEAARLLRACRGMPHVRRFILIGLYTGTRSGSILRLSWLPSISTGYVDLEAGILYRAGSNQRTTKKRQPPAKLSSRLLTHLKRWKQMDGHIRHVISWNGSSVKCVKKAFANARKRAGLDDKVIPHTLRHSCATWLMQAGVSQWDAAGFLGMTMEVLDRVYSHPSSPEFQRAASEAIRSA